MVWNVGYRVPGECLGGAENIVTDAGDGAGVVECWNGPKVKRYLIRNEKMSAYFDNIFLKLSETTLSAIKKKYSWLQPTSLL